MPPPATRTLAGRSYPTGGDVITAVDGTAVATADALRAAVEAKSPGDRISLTFARGGNEHSVSLTLAARPS